jgi:hypothetical protein
VTFSSTAVRKLLDDEFVCTLINTEGDPTAGVSMGHAPSDPPGPCSRGVGKQNVQCLFLTSDGKVFHAVSGFVGPDDMKDELQFGLTLFKTLRKMPSRAKEAVIDAHAKRLKTLGFTDAEVKQAKSAQTGFDFGGVMQVPGFSTDGDHFDAKKDKGFFGLGSRATVLHDYRFVMTNPLLAMGDFLKKPQLLVGSGKSAFVSTGNGIPSGGPIGTPR